MPERTPVRAVRNGGLDFMATPTRDESLIAAYLDERRGYVVRGLTERVAEVDAELRRLGFAPAHHDITPARRRSK